MEYIVTKPRALLFASWLVILCWVCLALYFVGIVPAMLGWPYLLPSLFIFILLAFIQIAVSVFCRCPSCDRITLIQGFTPPHDNAKKVVGIRAWVVVVIHIVRTKQFTCIHCGAHCRLQAHNNSSNLTGAQNAPSS